MYISQKYSKDLGHTLVFEIGALNSRVGFAGCERPQAILPSFTTGLEHTSERESLEWWAQVPRPGVQLYPITQGGNLTDWEGLQNLMEYSLREKLMTQSQESSALFVDPIASSKESRNKLVELLFEGFSFRSAFMQKAPVLASYMCAKETVLIVDVGAEYTQIVPIVQGFISTRGLVRTQFGGETLTRQLLQFIERKTGGAPSRFLQRSIEGCTSSVQTFNKLEYSRQLKETVCQILEMRLSDLRFNQTTDRSAFELPDKNRIDIGLEMFSIPEKMFSQTGSFKGVQRMIQGSLQKLDIDVRKEMLSNINIIGGGSCFGRFTERLQAELQGLDLYGLYNRLKIYSPENEEKVNANWLGGSILGSMPESEKWVVTKKEYDEQGPSCLDRKLA